MCIDALEKQIAKKVINKQPNPCTGIIGNCCRCGNGAYTINPTFTYCIWCGQKLDWSGIDE